MTPESRRHDIDALRALAFGLLILYHVGMYYVAAWPWHLKSPQAAAWLQAPMQVVNIWRMDLVFLVSGVALGFLFRGRDPLALIRQRALRLMLPLVFGMTVVVPYQAYAEALARGLVAPGFGGFMLRYLAMGPWPKGAFAGSDFGMTWNHLWYLPYLFVYTALVALLQPLLGSAAGQRLRAAFTGLRRWRLLVLPALPLLLYALTLAPRFPATHDLLHDGYLHPLYFTVFLYGYWMGIDAGLWRELERLRGWALALAVGFVAAYLALRGSGRRGLAAARSARLLPVDGDRRHPGLRPPLPGPPLALAALGQRVGLPLVHAAPDPDRGRRRAARALAAGAGAGARAAGRLHRGRLLGPDRWADPPHRLAAPPVRAQAAAPTGS